MTLQTKTFEEIITFSGVWGAVSNSTLGDATWSQAVQGSCVDNLWFDNWTREALRKDIFFAQTKHKIMKKYFSPVFIPKLISGLFNR